MTDQCQHTPGPWRTGVPGRGRFCVYSVSAHGRGVCVMSNTVEPPSPSDHELNLIADANARLIAAAPVMLAALQKLVAADNCNYLVETMRYEGYFDAARAAIAAATGEVS